MNTNVTIHKPAGDLPSTALNATRQYFEAARADATTRAYATQWSAFQSWALDHGYDPMPAAPEVVAVHLAELAQRGYAVASIKARAAAITAVHIYAQHPTPCNAQQVRETLKGITRTHGTKQRQARGITDRVVSKIESHIEHTIRDRRDFAMLMIARDLLARRSELAALDMDDIEIDAATGDGTAVIRRSKTDQEGQGAALYISPAAAAALTAYTDAAQITEGPIFRSIYQDGSARGRISTKAIARAFKRLAERAGLDPSEISGHSARVGMAQDLAAAGASTTDLQTAGRWTSPAMPARYTQRQAARRSPVARYHNAA